MQVNIEDKTINIIMDNNTVKQIENIITSISNKHEFNILTTIPLFEHIMMRVAIAKLLDNYKDMLSTNITYTVRVRIDSDVYNLTLRYNESEELHGWIYGLSLLKPYD